MKYRYIFRSHFIFTLMVIFLKPDRYDPSPYGTRTRNDDCTGTSECSLTLSLTCRTGFSHQYPGIPAAVPPSPLSCPLSPSPPHPSHHSHFHRFPHHPQHHHCPPHLQLCSPLPSSLLLQPGLRIRIHFIRIRIQHFRLNTNTDPGL